MYRNYKETEEMFDSQEHYSLVSDYFIGEKMNRRKPILWMHTSTEVNARNWESFYSRNTTRLNQPYLQITMKSIYDKCKDSFNICLIDDDVFRRLLSWNIDLEDLADPMKSHYRQLGLSMLLHQYGGFLVPQSFLCTKNLIDLYRQGLSSHTMFVIENVNHGITYDQSPFSASMDMMACKKKSTKMDEFVRFQETLYKDRTNQSDFIGNTSLWLQKNVHTINGACIGIKKTDGKPVSIEELLGMEQIQLPALYGIYLPQDEILSRTKYNWFARMSTKQILKSRLCISKYMAQS